MSVLWIVIPMALLLAAVGVAAFMWTVKTGQMDDLETPATRILFDDDDVTSPDETDAVP